SGDAVVVVEISMELRCVREIRKSFAHRLTTSGQCRVRNRSLRTNDNIGARRISELSNRISQDPFRPHLVADGAWWHVRLLDLETCQSARHKIRISDICSAF